MKSLMDEEFEKWWQEYGLSYYPNEDQARNCFEAGWIKCHYVVCEGQGV